ncbi:MAG: YIP1 family protein [Anaerolineae bacterium]|nr:YIP1 family protein [Anaerolineae bacterium]
MTFVQRIQGVFRLSADTFEDIEADKGATGQAALVVFLVALMAGIGAYISTSGAVDFGSVASSVEAYDASFVTGELTPMGAFAHEFVGAFVAWLLWAFLTFLIAGKLFGGETDLGEMLRTIGFAQAPRLLSVFAFIPCIGFILAMAGWMIALIGTVLAIQRSADLDAFKSFGAVILSFIAVGIVHFFVLPPLVRAIFG